jgi:biotin operon repressor
MSNQLISEVQKRVVGSLVRKSVLLNMADKVTNDGTGFWAAKSTIAEEVGCSKSSVKHALKQFRTQGLIVLVGRRRCASGYTNQYRLDIDAIQNLPLIDKRKRVISTASYQQGRHPATPSGASDDPQEGHVATPNLSLTIQEPNCGGVAEQDVEFSSGFLDDFFSAYPRIKSKEKTIYNLRSAIALGATEAEIIYGVKAYKEEQQGNSQVYIMYSDNWVEKRCWENFPMLKVGLFGVVSETVIQGYLRAILSENATLGKHCPPLVAKKLIAQGSVTLEQCLVVGIDL